MAFEAAPVLLSFLAFGQIQLRDQLLSPLQRDRFAVVVIVTNDVLLIFRMFGHAATFCTGTRNGQDCIRPDVVVGIVELLDCQIFRFYRRARLCCGATALLN